MDERTKALEKNYQYETEPSHVQVDQAYLIENEFGTRSDMMLTIGQEVGKRKTTNSKEEITSENNEMLIHAFRVGYNDAKEGVKPPISNLVEKGLVDLFQQDQLENLLVKIVSVLCWQSQMV